MDEIKNVCFTKTEDMLHIWRTHGPNAYLAIQICREFKLSKRFTELASFVEELPETSEYKTEEIIRFKIFVAWLRRNCQLVYKLIKENSFANGEDLIEIWDKAHYYEEEKKKGKDLSVLARFRVRQKYVPPLNICPSGVRRKLRLPKEATQVLRGWLKKNINYPYPSQEVKFALVNQSGLTAAQVNTWLANARRRLKLSVSKYKRATRPRIMRNDSTPQQVTTSAQYCPSTSSTSWCDRLSPIEKDNAGADAKFPRLLGQQMGFVAPTGHMYGFNPAFAGFMDPTTCAMQFKTDSNRTIVNQSLFSFPEQFLVPRHPICSLFPVTDAFRKEDDKGLTPLTPHQLPVSVSDDQVPYRTQFITSQPFHSPLLVLPNPLSPIMKPNIRSIEPPFTHLIPSGHSITTTNRCTPEVTLPGNQSYIGLSAAQILIDMANNALK